MKTDLEKAPMDIANYYVFFFKSGQSMVFRAIILKRGYAWSVLRTTTTMS